MDPSIPLIEEAKQRSNIAFEEMKEILINIGLDEQSAKDKACSNILPKLLKELENMYMEHLVWMRQLKKDPVHKKIMHAKDELVEKDDFIQKVATYNNCDITFLAMFIPVCLTLPSGRNRTFDRAMTDSFHMSTRS
jgi:hypothetical protein